MALSSGGLMAQELTGIYVVRAENTNCGNKKKLLNSITSHCLENLPLIGTDGIAAVGDITYSENKSLRQFDIAFRPESSRMLNSLARMSDENRIAVVVNDILVSVISVRQPFNSRLITLWDQSDSDDFQDIHRELSAMVNGNQ